MDLWLTPTQDVIFSFNLRFSHIPESDTRIRVDLFPESNLELGEKKLLPGTRFSALDRKATFRFTVPELILPGRRKRKRLSSLGTFKLLQRGRQIYHENLIGALIIDNNTYFEKRVVPRVLQGMGYITEVIGGRNEPDTIAFHRIINPSEKIDVESTITSNYNMARWDHDYGKFCRYRRERRLSRLLIVTQSDNISKEVLDLLNETRDPIGLIEFRDLKLLHCTFRRNRDYVSIVARLSSSGKIACPGGPSIFPIFLPQRVKIPRII